MVDNGANVDICANWALADYLSTTRARSFKQFLTTPKKIIQSNNSCKNDNMPCVHRKSIRLCAYNYFQCTYIIIVYDCKYYKTNNLQ